MPSLRSTVAYWTKPLGKSSGNSTPVNVGRSVGVPEGVLLDAEEQAVTMRIKMSNGMRRVVMCRC